MGPTDDAGAMADPDPDGIVDPEAARMAHEIVARLRMSRPRRTSATGPFRGPLETHLYRHDAGDLDLDRTLEVVIGQPVLTEEHIYVRERGRAEQSVILLADVSGSMRGEKVRTMAATVAALATHLRADQLAILAFWSDAAWIARFGDRSTPHAVLDSLLRLPTQGLTNLAFPLAEAGRVVRRAPRGGTRVLMLSDCVHNAGPDPRSLAARIGRLDVLMDASDEHDEATASELARLGGGRMCSVRTYHDVGKGLNGLFAA
jgi:Mg-chelatase subunit ChlD